ncbi:phage tail protein [Saccharibacillus sacchari]|uniref:Tail fiber protein n=1 Tax=Saccharibacillus sacchari TaxID=456493 RepID=A0ACC6PAV5_9BACL
MSNPYIGEIRMFAGNYAPRDWAFCNGQLMQISENEALFVLLGTTYGGDGQQTFGLPNLSGRIPVHVGNGLALGKADGNETVTVAAAQLPQHTHAALASTTPGTLASPAGAVWSASALQNYSDGTGATSAAMNAQSLVASGGNQPHDNIMPSLAVSFIIALVGIFPTQG